MCGIAGIRRFDGKPVNDDQIKVMLSQLLHRGPDSTGLWNDGRSVALGHTRLSIIDVHGSAQPMSSRDNKVHLVFNGEILNYREIRNELRDYPYRTVGDTETILAAYSYDGPLGVRRLRGQFAFAIHDEHSGETHLVRDRLGVLPLFYYADTQFVAFASEIKALLQIIPSPTLDEESLGDYLAHRAVPAPYTFIKGVNKLLPGHILTLSQNGNIRIREYWSMPNGLTPQVWRSPQDAVYEVKTALERSVRESLIADVPVGIFLSGGVDSGLIAAIATEEVREKKSLHTFTASFGHHAQDEAAWARVVSNSLQTMHHEVEVSADDFLQDWPKLSWHRDAPLSEPADVALYRLASLAKDHVKVALSGEGSDEIFGGYPKYVFAAATQWQTGTFVRSLMGRGERALASKFSRLRVPLRALSQPTREERLRGWFAPFTFSERAALLGRNSLRQSLRPYETGLGDPLQRMMYADMFTWLGDNLLERGDRMAMAASLETRPPFLDFRLVELASRIPSSYKIHRGRTKWILKQVARHYLPNEVIERPKVGFKVPLDDWFRGGLKTFACDKLLSSSSLSTTVFSAKEIRRLLDDHLSGRRDEEIRIWTLLSLEVWHGEMAVRNIF